MEWAVLAHSHKVWPSLRSLGIDLGPHEEKEVGFYLDIRGPSAGVPATSQKLPCSLH